MKKLILLTMLFGLTGCSDNNQSDTNQTNTQANILQKAEVAPTVVNYSLAASPRAMSAVDPLAGWGITNSMVTGASTLIDAIKGSKTSFAQVKPNAKQVAEVLRGGAAGIALTIAVDQLLDAVDWVMDPANSQIRYKVINYDQQYRYSNNEVLEYTGIQYVFSIAEAESAFKQFFSKLNRNYVFVGCKINPNVNNRIDCTWGYPNEKPDRVVPFTPSINPNFGEKTLPLETVAEKVISNADAGSLDAQVATNIAAQNILNDVVQAEPVVQELENNAKKPPCITVSGKVVTVGTYGYRHDKVPPSKPHYPFTGDHYNLYRANQNPNNGKCFWVESGAADASDGKLPPPNSIPIEPFI